jgi:hypothetical protein
MDRNNMQFDEAEINYLFLAVIEFLKSKKWDVMDEEEWLQASNLKSIMNRMGKFLDGEQL